MRIFVLSDPHFAGIAEQARRGWERRAIPGSTLRLLAFIYRRWVWLADPTAHNHQLDTFVAHARGADLVVANGDYSCDSAFVGLSDDAACASARDCLGRLGEAFGDRLLTTLGDHELGKVSLFGGAGGPRVASWLRCLHELRLSPLWKRDLGRHVLVGVASSILALPAFEPEMLASERATWASIREEYLIALRDLWKGIRQDQRIILFCHDPAALPYLVREALGGAVPSQVEFTVIGHLHSPLVFRTGFLLAGIPEVGWLGHTARRITGALRKARAWRPFRLVLCPSLAGIQLLKDGGYLEIVLDPSGMAPPRIHRHRLPWRRS